MNCPECGAQLYEDSIYCHRCGKCVNEEALPTEQTEATEAVTEDAPKKNNNTRNNVIFFISILVSAVVVFIVAVMMVYMIMTEQGPFKPSPTPMPTMVAAVTEEPIPLPTSYVPVEETDSPTLKPSVYSKNVILDPEYLTFEDSDYGFECAYPSHFKEYNDGGSTLYTVRTKDGGTSQAISAQEIEDETVESAMEEFIDDNNGTVVYKNSGDDYFAVNIRQGSIEKYRYCKFSGENMYWFEFICPADYREVYDEYIDYICDSLKIY